MPIKQVSIQLVSVAGDTALVQFDHENSVSYGFSIALLKNKMQATSIDDMLMLVALRLVAHGCTPDTLTVEEAKAITESTPFEVAA
jgi:hypothetical protein